MFAIFHCGTKGNGQILQGFAVYKTQALKWGADLIFSTVSRF